MKIINKNEVDVQLNFTKHINTYLEKLKQVIDGVDREQVNLTIEKLLEVHQRQGYVYIFGNGGSASTASHFSNDFNSISSHKLKRKFRFITLSDNTPLLLAIANDIGYEQVFKVQLENFLTPNDLVIGISTTGNSQNVINAIEYANLIGAETIGLVGFDGGKLKQIARHSIHIHDRNMQQVENLHLILNHLMTWIVKSYLESVTDDY